MAYEFDVGDMPSFTVTFRDEADVITDPTTVVFKIHPATAAEYEVTAPNAAITKLSTGVYKYTFPTPIPNDPGRWAVRGKGTVGLVAADEILFNVRRSVFTTP